MMTTEGGAAVEPLLAIDDDPILLSVYRRALSAAGYQVDTATNAEEAQNKFKQRNYSAILSDIAMPGMDGIGLLRAVRKYDQDVPVILVTGLPSIKTAMAAVNEGAFRYLLKPLEVSVLEESVHHAVRSHQRAELRRQALANLGLTEPQPGDREALQVRFERGLAGLWVAFQPIVDAKTHGLFAYEGLLRTAEPSLPSPGAFLNAAEQLGHLSTLGRAVRSTAAAQLAQVHGACSLFVNLHPADLADDRILDAAAPLSQVASRVVLEITERSMLESVPQAVERIRSLRSMGFRLAIDDLGSGYSGLNSFVQLEPEIVKLDMSLVRGIEDSLVKRKLVKSLTDVCQDLGIRVVAEGIETEGESQALTGLGCDLLQGYLFGRPAWPVVPVASTDELPLRCRGIGG